MPFIKGAPKYIISKTEAVIVEDQDANKYKTKAQHDVVGQCLYLIKDLHDGEMRHGDRIAVDDEGGVELRGVVRGMRGTGEPTDDVHVGHTSGWFLPAAQFAAAVRLWRAAGFDDAEVLKPNGVADAAPARGPDSQ